MATMHEGMVEMLGHLRFDPAVGRIWLEQQRMLLIHADSIGALRRELIDALGLHRARAAFTRIGFEAGACDAVIARAHLADRPTSEAFLIGPLLHSIEGIVHVEPVVLDIGEQPGRFHGEFIWRGSVEDEQHTRLFGIGASPSCWMQIGYASGFTSRFLDDPILYREVECRAMGHADCRIVGRPLHAWAPDEIADDLQFFDGCVWLARPTDTAGAPWLPGVRPPTGVPDAPVRGAASRSMHPPPAAPSTDGTGFEGISGCSVGFSVVRHQITCVADTLATVLFLGESGVGKEVFAQALHRASPRRDRPFVAVNCASIPDALIEAELFGVEKGAYTGAQSARLGRFERAAGGTLFLDEIGILSHGAQGKLLRVLQQGEFERVGDQKTRRADVRVVAATNLDLRREVQAGRFREDLFYRLNVFPIRIPPLRERIEDIVPLAQLFLQRFAVRHGRAPHGFTPAALQQMLSYHWPGNVRELENMVERGVIMSRSAGPVDVGHLFSTGEELTARGFNVRDDGRIGAADDGCMPAAADMAQAPPPSHDPLPMQHPELCWAATLLQRAAGTADGGDAGDAPGVGLDALEAVLIRAAMGIAGGNRAAAARLLGITRPQLVYRWRSLAPSRPDPAAC